MILLLGSTGLLGKSVLQVAQKKKLPLRILARGHEDWREAPHAHLRAQGVDVRYGDVLNKVHLQKALEGCDTVVNMIGSLGASSPSELLAVNYQSLANVIELAKQSGVKRLLHVSCLGANQTSASASLRAKWQAEELVRTSDIYWTIFRPSFLFGESCRFLEIIDPILRFKPFLPVIGSGLNLIQPVSTPAVAECIVRSIYDRDSVGKTYELAGGKKLSMIDFMELARQKLQLSGPTLNIPIQITSGAHIVLSKAIPKHIKNSDVMLLLTADSATDDNALEHKFHLQSEDIEVHLAALLIRT